MPIHYIKYTVQRISSKHTPLLYRIGMIVKPICIICKLYSTTPYEMETHVRSNTVLIRFNCDYCNQKYGIKTENSLMPLLFDYVRQVPQEGEN